MKRNKQSYPKVKIIKPFFWKECRFCKREFKREKGYLIEDFTKINPRLYFSYCCNECASSIEEVKEAIKK
ncbi:hypothetical protein GOQ29_05095 [Clostridium sp. D2Q-14]|uniref:hypothetical protein n=1 Tax=Anaeromonas gelatinilytica TaxID=2683194 RepID=UPI00193B5515|nr:hypothetical protein [Anaeromonas gelatinilytica]MBS4534993.1 hypothetical protein [Anaeromonas gelatinilytica]